MFAVRQSLLAFALLAGAFYGARAAEEPNQQADPQESKAKITIGKDTTYIPSRCARTAIPTTSPLSPSA